MTWKCSLHLHVSPKLDNTTIQQNSPKRSKISWWKYQTIVSLPLTIEQRIH